MRCRTVCMLPINARESALLSLSVNLAVKVSFLFLVLLDGRLEAGGRSFRRLPLISPYVTTYSRSMSPMKLICPSPRPKCELARHWPNSLSTDNYIGWMRARERELLPVALPPSPSDRLISALTTPLP
jgi:hypothetical protein